MPLGLSYQDHFGSYKRKLGRGDLLLCYTDALSEVQTDSGLLKTEGLLRLLESLDASQPDTLIPALIEAIEAEVEGALAHDDCTVMLLECTNSSPRLRDTLSAPFRLLRSWFSRA